MQLLLVKILIGASALYLVSIYFGTILHKGKSGCGACCGDQGAQGGCPVTARQKSV